MKNYISKYMACLSASLFSFYDLFQLSLFNSISTDLLVAFKLTSAQLSILSSMFLLANSLALIPFGILIDRFSVRSLAFITLTLSSFACFITALSHSVAIIMFMRFLQGIASAASLLICMRLAINWFSENANFAIGIMVSIALLGGTLGNYIFTLIVYHIGWQHALHIAGYLGFIILFILFLFLYDADNCLKNLSIYKLSNIKHAIFNICNIIFGAYLGLMSLPIFILASLWGNLFLTQRHYVSSSQAGLIVSLLFLGLVIGSPINGYISDKAKNKIFIMGIGLLTSAILFSFLIKYNLNYYALCLLFLLIGSTLSSQNTAYSIINTNNLTEVRSTAVALSAFIANLIGMMGQIIFGKLLNIDWKLAPLGANTIDTEMSFIKAFTIFPAAFIICYALLCVANRKLTKR